MTRAAKAIDQLISIMQRLRDPNGGCPWDLKQDFSTIAKHTLEEAYEVVDAIELQNWDDLKGELGDLMFQVIFYAQMAAEKNWYDFADIVELINEKMIKRHPHVFGTQEGITTSDDQIKNWEKQKAEERDSEGNTSVLAGVTAALPALSRAVKLQDRAARVGFEWATIEPMFDKLQEEIGELQQEIAAGAGEARLTDELGDVLFMVVNLCRTLKVDPETALRGANAKFTRRFTAIETGLAARGKTPETSTLEEMEALWQAAKRS